MPFDKLRIYELATFSNHECGWNFEDGKSKILFIMKGRERLISMREVYPHLELEQPLVEVHGKSVLSLSMNGLDVRRLNILGVSIPIHQEIFDKIAKYDDEKFQEAYQKWVKKVRGGTVR